MAKPKLNRPEKNALRGASRQAIHKAFRKLSRHFRSRRWIGNDNRYRENCIGKLKNDVRKGIVDQKHLSQYIAASAPLHCTDGWGYLGRAIVCHAQGNINVARHLAYYAELRAAMSLLATEGIGIFDRHHFVMDSIGSCKQLARTLGTHVITWLILEHWADRKPSTDLLAKIISAGGVSLQEWLSNFMGGATAGPVGNRWLKSWGLDLQRFSDDHDSRNQASYRPTWLNPWQILGASASSQFSLHLWNLYEPAGNSRFETLDRHLLRLCLKQTYEARTGNKIAINQTGFENEIERMLNRVAPSGLSADTWRNFLTWKIEPDLPRVIVESIGTAQVNSPYHHLQVIARAALLLRVATGACAYLLRNVGFVRADLDFWCQSLGENLGLWESGEPPEEFTDLWADVEAALEEARAWEVTNSGLPVSYAKWHRDQPLSISVLGECERIALWGLGL